MADSFSPEWRVKAKDGTIISLPYKIALNSTRFRDFVEFVLLANGSSNPSPVKENQKDEYWLDEPEEILTALRKAISAEDGECDQNFDYSPETFERLISLYKNATPEMSERFPYTKKGVMFECLDGQMVPKFDPEDITPTEKEFKIVTGNVENVVTARIHAEEVAMLAQKLELEYATVMAARCVGKISNDIIESYYEKAGNPKTEEDIYKCRIHEREVLKIVPEMEEEHIHTILDTARASLFKTKDGSDEPLEDKEKLAHLNTYIDEVVQTLRWNDCILEILKSVSLVKPDDDDRNVRDRTNVVLKAEELLEEGDEDKPFSDVIERILNDKPETLEKKLKPYSYKPAESLKGYEDELTRIAKYSFKVHYELDLQVQIRIYSEFLPCHQADE